MGVAGSPQTNSVEWLHSGGQAFPLMLEAIRAARVSVRLEMFIFDAGMPGDAFLEALVAAAGRGVRVSVLLDALGSSELADAYWQPLRRAGGELWWFNRFRSVWAMVRDHRKMLVCDDAVAFLGGFNIAPEYDGDGVVSGWRDTGVRIHGPVAARLGQLFEGQIRASGERRPWTLRWRRRFEEGNGDDGSARVLPVSPGRGLSSLSEALIADLAKARNATVVTPYFLPSPAIRRALRKAALRGARVRVVLPAHSDVRLAQLAARWLYAALLRSGVEILEYEPAVLHAKVFLVDDAVYVGSSNLDPRSLHLNYEIMLRLEQPEAVAAAGADVMDMVSRSRAIHRDQWAPSRGGWEKMREWWAFSLLYRLDPWLTGWLTRPGR